MTEKTFFWRKYDCTAIYIIYIYNNETVEIVEQSFRVEYELFIREQNCVKYEPKYDSVKIKNLRYSSDVFRFLFRPFKMAAKRSTCTQRYYTQNAHFFIIVRLWKIVKQKEVRLRIRNSERMCNNTFESPACVRFCICHT